MTWQPSKHGHSELAAHQMSELKSIGFLINAERVVNDIGS